MKNILFGISLVTFQVSSCTKFQIIRGSAPDIRGSAPDPAGGTYSARPDPLAGGEGGSKNSTPTLGPSGLGLRPFGPKLRPPPST